MKREPGVFQIGDRVADVNPIPYSQLYRFGTVWKISAKISVHWDGCEHYQGYNKCHYKPEQLRLLPEAPE